jgi:catechol 2,3-dioxygenase-like lactoylglutathione lyase family enzyme
MAEETGIVKSVSELAFWVKDLDRSVAFYRDRQGFTVDEVDPGRNAFLRSGDFLLVAWKCAVPSISAAAAAPSSSKTRMSTTSS